MGAGEDGGDEMTNLDPGRCSSESYTCFPFLARATVSSSSAHLFSSAVFPTAELYVGPSLPHWLPPPTTRQEPDHTPNCQDRIHAHAK